MVTLVYRGATHDVVARDATELIQAARELFGLSPDDGIRLVHRGKQLGPSADLTFISGKILVMATTAQAAETLNSSRADPTIRPFEADDRDDARRKEDSSAAKMSTVWHAAQDPRYKFTRFEVVSWQSFGHRPGSTTPHAFAARELLEKLATDPGVVACMRARELVVGTLGEMDPIDDRLMKAKRGEGGDLLGYNTNGGMRIDIKLRTDDLSGFMPYPRLVETLLHELCHNWVGPHNKLFWTLFAQMRVEYLHEHMRIAARGTLIDGKTTAALAGVHADCVAGSRVIAEAVLRGIAEEVGVPMAQELHAAVEDHIRFMEIESAGEQRGRVLGATPDGGVSAAAESTTAWDPRARAAAAAEARAAARGLQFGKGHGPAGSPGSQD